MKVTTAIVTYVGKELPSVGVSIPSKGGLRSLMSKNATLRPKQDAELLALLAGRWLDFEEVSGWRPWRRGRGFRSLQRLTHSSRWQSRWPSGRRVVGSRD